MKGQHLIITEIILFSLGVLITAHVVASFQSVQNSLGGIALKDHFGSVADIAAAGVVKAVESNSTVAITFPAEISQRIYVISLLDNSVVVSDLSNTNINVTKKLFNITQGNCNNVPEGMFCSGTTLFENAVVSTAGRAEIFTEGRTIKIRRG